MRNEKVIYEIDGLPFEGYWSFPKNQEKRPAVIVAHAWMGQDDFARQKADEIASLGYVGFAVDLYGKGKIAKNPSEAQELMIPLFFDRVLLQRRICSALRLVQQHPLVDSYKVGAIGFCFGGLSVIELLRSGIDVKAVVAFHAVLGNALRGKVAKTVPIAQAIEGSLLVLHGHDDPLVSEQDIQHFQTEFTKAKVDWQMNIYSHTTHAFTNPAAHDQEHGLYFQPKSAARAWSAMVQFFDEMFGS